MDDHEVHKLFQDAPTQIVDNPLLREPQIEGYEAVRQHFALSREHAIVQIPVGCGKTGLMSIMPFGIAEGRILIIAPNLEIRRGVAAALDISQRDCFWRKTRVLDDFTSGPFRAELDADANIHDCRDAHFVVTNIHQLASRADRWLPAFDDDFFDLILVDEAHHNAAESWQRVFERFPNAKVVSLTATPFRSDGGVAAFAVERGNPKGAENRGHAEGRPVEALAIRSLGGMTPAIVSRSPATVAGLTPTCV